MFARLNAPKNLQNLRRGYHVYRSWTECGLGDADQPFQLAQRGGGFALAALLVEKFGREMFECVGLCRSHSELREPLLLARVETSVQLTLWIVTPPPRLFKRDRRIRTDRELALFAGESIGEIP